LDNRELKNAIENKTLSNNPLVLKYNACSKYVVDQYIKSIGENFNKSILKIGSIQEYLDATDNVFDDDLSQNTIYTYAVEKLEENVLPDYKNLIVSCNKITADLSVDYVEIIDTLPWHIEAFVASRLPGLLKEQIHWLCEISKYDIYRLEQECNKISIFPQNAQKIIFEEICNDNGYADLNSLTIFNFTTAFLKRDMATILEVLNNLKFIDIEGTGMVTILLKNIKNLIDVEMSTKATAEALGMSPKQFAAISYNKGKFSNKQLINTYEFLLNIDRDIKSGDLSFATNHTDNNRILTEYLTVNMLNFLR